MRFTLAILVFAGWFLTGRHLSRSDGVQAWAERLWIYVVMGTVLVASVWLFADSPDEFAVAAMLTGLLVVIHAVVVLLRGAISGIKSRSIMVFVRSFGRGLGNIFVWLLIFVVSSSGLEDVQGSANPPAATGMEEELVTVPPLSEAPKGDESPGVSELSESPPGETQSTTGDLSETASGQDELSSDGADVIEVGPTASSGAQPGDALVTVEMPELLPEREPTEGAAERHAAELVETGLANAQDPRTIEASGLAPEPNAVDAVAEGQDAEALEIEVVSADEAPIMEPSGHLPRLETVAAEDPVLEEASPAKDIVVAPEAPRSVEFTIVSEPIAAEILVRSATTTLRSIGRGKAVVTWPVGEKLFYSIRPADGSGYLHFNGEVIVNEAATHPVWLTPAPVTAAPSPSSYPADSPERRVVEWFAAYARKDWNSMTNMRLPSQRDREAAYNWIEGTYFFRDVRNLISVNVLSRNEVSARVRVTWEHSLGRSYVDLVLIREDGRGNPWAYAPWSISYTSATGVRTAN